MADHENKVPENVPGKYYVDMNCSLCSICEDTAPNNFEVGDEHAAVIKQPENEEEEEQCRQAMEECPEEVIGDDG